MIISLKLRKLNKMLQHFHSCQNHFQIQYSWFVPTFLQKIILHYILNVLTSIFTVCEGDLNPIIEKINSFLPPEIRVHAIKRVTKNFNSKTACDARYDYYLVTGRI